MLRGRDGKSHHPLSFPSTSTVQPVKVRPKIFQKAQPLPSTAFSGRHSLESALPTRLVPPFSASASSGVDEEAIIFSAHFGQFGCSGSRSLSLHHSALHVILHPSMPPRVQANYFRERSEEVLSFTTRGSPSTDFYFVSHHPCSICCIFLGSFSTASCAVGRRIVFFLRLADFLILTSSSRLPPPSLPSRVWRPVLDCVRITTDCSPCVRRNVAFPSWGGN